MVKPQVQLLYHTISDSFQALSYLPCPHSVFVASPLNLLDDALSFIFNVG